MKKKNLEERKNDFLKKAIEIHGDKYDYSKVEYVNNHTKVCIICPEHGEFWQLPLSHVSKKNYRGCPKCTGFKIAFEEFIKRAKLKHGDRYTYDESTYQCGEKKTRIICPEHGEFWQTASNHVRGAGCPRCSHQSYKDNTESFIEKARKIHGDKYDYSKVEYINSHTKVCIVCPKHGEFWQIPTNHLRGKGCKHCMIDDSKIRNLGNKEELIEKLRMIHGNKYDYSQIEYVDRATPVYLICPKHGGFWKTPNRLLDGAGCPRCRMSKIENAVDVALSKNNILYESGKHFKWLKRQHIDFYLPEYNIGIECQGEQHFVKVNKFKSKPSHVIEYDRKKNELCQNNKIKLLYFVNGKFFDQLDENNIPSFYIQNQNLFTKIDNLIKKIKEGS